MKKTHKLLCLALFTLIVSNAQSQTAPAFYQPKMGGAAGGNEIIKSITGDNSGYTIAVGSFTSASFNLGGITLTNTTNADTADMFIAKYDAEGNVVWAHSAGGTADDSAYSIAQDQANNFYVLGSFLSPTITFGTTTLNNAGGAGTCDIFIVKYDAFGNVVWARSEGGAGDDYPGDIAIDYGNNMYITGNFTSNPLIVGGTTLTNNGATDVFYAKYDTSGAPIWAGSAGDFADDYARAITTDINGDVYITGSYLSSSISFGSTILNTNGVENAFIAKINPSGIVQWAHSSGYTSSDRAIDINTDYNGDIYISGSFNSPTFRFDNSADSLANNNTDFSYDIFTVKYDNTGAVLWAQRAGAEGNDIANAMNVDACNNIYVCGSFASTNPINFGSSTLNLNAGTDMLLLKYNENGGEVFAKSVNDANNETGTAVSGNIDGNVVVAGYTNSPTVSLDGTVLTNSDGTGAHNDFFLAKVQTTATGIYAFISYLSAPVNNAWVYLYARLPSYKLLQPLDSVQLSGTNVAHFANVLNLNYFIKVNADTTLYHGAMPTYNDSICLWDSVSVWPHTCNTDDSINIGILPQISSGTGQGTISGTVAKTANYGHAPMTLYASGVSVKIRHNSGHMPVTNATTTDVSGFYIFYNVDTGLYSVAVDIPGLGRYNPYTAHITDSTTYSNLCYIADSDYVFRDTLSACGLVQVKSINEQSKITVAPNPFSSQTVIAFSEKQTLTTIQIFDVVGNEIKTITLTNATGFTLQRGDLTSGIYFMSVTDEKKKRINKKLVIQ